MSTAFLLIIILILLLSAIIYLLYDRKKQGNNGDLNSRIDNMSNSLISHLSQQMDAMRSQVNKGLEQNVNFMQRSHQDTSRSVGTLQSKLIQLEEATKRIFEVGKDISSLQDILKSPKLRDISSLQDILKSPKLRGNIGELFLEDLLSQYLPKNYYNLQHQFKSGEQVDAIIKLERMMIPVDSKFPLESFKRVLEIKNEEEQEKLKKEFIRSAKKHIDDISKKYILPDEGTSDFAIMYIPAENVYYEMIIKQDLSDYALSKKIIPTSPNSFWAYIQTIMIGLKGMSIEKSAKEILARLSRMQGDLNKFSQSFELIGSHLNNARAKYEESGRKLVRIQDKVKQLEEPKK